MELKEFQLNAVKSLFEAMDKPVRDIILKSPTGSGKTIILTYFMHQYIQSYPKTVFVWLTPGKGNLEEQSKAKMDKYIHASQTKLLSDVMTAGFEENDSCFINWEKLTKKGNNALKDSERTNFLEHIEHALNDGLHFVIIVDESHQNNTIKADEIIQYFRTEKIIRCSATPKGIAKAEVIEIPEEEVIAAGLIKKMLVINQNFPQTVETEDQTAYLLERALQKQRELRAAYLQMDVDINPLIIVQIPNKSETLLDGVERWFEAQGLTYENGQLAVWLSDRHENLEGIDAPAAPSTAVIIKQAVDQLNSASTTVESLRTLMNETASKLPEYPVVMAMKGVGTSLGSQLMAEIGDVSRFTHKSAITAFAGVDPGVNESGSYEQKSVPTSKRGSSDLRKTLFQVMDVLIKTHPQDDPVYQFLDKKRAQGKPYYVYMTAGANKFLRIYYGRVKEYLSSLPES